MSNKAKINKPKSELKMIRISRRVGDKLVVFITNSTKRINAGQFIDQAILEKMQRETKL